MAKRMQFKRSDTVLNVPGMGRITNDNITNETYDRLIQVSASHADLFEEKEVSDEPLFITPKKEVAEEKQKTRTKNGSTDI